MAPWSLKRRMYGLWSLCYGKCITQLQDGPSVIEFLKSVYIQLYIYIYIYIYTIQFLKLLTLSPKILVLAYSEPLDLFLVFYTIYYTGFLCFVVFHSDFFQTLFSNQRFHVNDSFFHDGGYKADKVIKLF